MRVPPSDPESAVPLAPTGFALSVIGLLLRPRKRLELVHWRVLQKGASPEGAHAMVHDEAPEVPRAPNFAAMGPGLRLQARTVARLSLFVDTSVWSLALRRDAPARTRTPPEPRGSGGSFIW